MIRSRPRPTGRGRLLGVAALALLAPAFLAGCQGSDDDVAVGDGETGYSGPYNAEIAEDLVELAGEEVVLQGMVELSIVDETFLLTDADGTAPPVLVFLDEGDEPEVEEGYQVQVRGTVHDAVELDDWVDEWPLDPQDESDWADYPATVFIAAVDVEIMEYD